MTWIPGVIGVVIFGLWMYYMASRSDKLRQEVRRLEKWNSLFSGRISDLEFKVQNSEDNIDRHRVRLKELEE